MGRELKHAYKGTPMGQGAKPGGGEAEMTAVKEASDSPAIRGILMTTLMMTRAIENTGSSSNNPYQWNVTNNKHNSGNDSWKDNRNLMANPVGKSRSGYLGKGNVDAVRGQLAKFNVGARHFQMGAETGGKPQSPTLTETAITSQFGQYRMSAQWGYLKSIDGGKWMNVKLKSIPKDKFTFYSKDEFINNLKGQAEYIAGGKEYADRMTLNGISDKAGENILPSDMQSVGKTHFPIAKTNHLTRDLTGQLNYIKTDFHDKALKR